MSCCIFARNGSPFHMTKFFLVHRDTAHNGRTSAPAAAATAASSSLLASAALPAPPWIHWVSTRPNPRQTLQCKMPLKWASLASSAASPPIPVLQRDRWGICRTAQSWRWVPKDLHDRVTHYGIQLSYTCDFSSEMREKVHLDGDSCWGGVVISTPVAGVHRWQAVKPGSVVAVQVPLVRAILQ